MTWTPAVETNLDFELSTLGTNTAIPGWTVDTGTYRVVSESSDGGTIGWRGDNTALAQISRSLAIPADSKKVRLTAWLGRRTPDADQCTAVLYLYDVLLNLIGGISLGSSDTNTLEVLEYVGECIVPAATDSVKLEVNAIRVGPTLNHGTCASTHVEWFIDSGLTIYETPTYLVNGGFELGDTPPTGWEHVSGNGLIATTDSLYVFEGTYGGWCTDGATQISQQSVFNVPADAEGLYFYAVAMSNADDSGDRLRMRLIFENAVGVELDQILIWGQCGNVRPVPMTVTATSIPVGTAVIRARAELYLASGSVVNCGFDFASLVFTSETGPIDVTPKVRVRRANDTWLQINPVFDGAGFAGLVPDPVSETDKYLRDDGTWQTPPGGGGGEANTASNIGTGDGLFSAKVGVDLEFKSLVAGTNITLTPSATEVEISASGGGGAVDSVNGQTGVVVLDADDISDAATTNKWATAAELADIALNTADRHVAVTVTDSSEIDFTLTGQDITASLITGSIDVLKLDAGVQASLALADTASQPGHTHAAADVISGMFADARISQSSVVQHEAALTITESQISDLGNYLLAVQDDPAPILGGDLDSDLFDIHNFFQVIHDDTTSYLGNNNTTIGEGHLYGVGSVDITGGDGILGFTTPGAVARSMVEFTKTLNFTLGTELFGTGFLFWNKATLISEAGSYFGGMYTLASQPTFQKAGTHSPTMQFHFDVFSQPTYERTGGSGALNIVRQASIVGEPILGPNVTATEVSPFLARAPIGTSNGNRGDITRFAGLWVENLDVTESGANTALLPANFSGIAIGLNALPTGNWSIYSDFERPARWNGGHFEKFNSYSTNQNIGPSHYIVEMTGATGRTFTLDTPTVGNPVLHFINSGSANLTLATAGAELIQGAATQTVAANGRYGVVWNGTGWRRLE